MYTMICFKCGKDKEVYEFGEEIEYTTDSIAGRVYYRFPREKCCPSCRTSHERQIRDKAVKEKRLMVEDEKRRERNKSDNKRFEEAGKLGNNLDEITRLKLQAIFFTQ
jgi:hypothetical protein